MFAEACTYFDLERDIMYICHDAVPGSNVHFVQLSLSLPTMPDKLELSKVKNLALRFTDDDWKFPHTINMLRAIKSYLCHFSGVRNLTILIEARLINRHKSRLLGSGYDWEKISLNKLKWFKAVEDKEGDPSWDLPETVKFKVISPRCFGGISRAQGKGKRGTGGDNESEH